MERHIPASLPTILFLDAYVNIQLYIYTNNCYIVLLHILRMYILSVYMLYFLSFLALIY